MFIGGEFYDDPQWLRPQKTLFTGDMHFLNGGRACLAVIGDFLRQNGIRQILLPDYLCPSIVTILTLRGLECTFYRVEDDFSLNLQDLKQKCQGIRAVYFINYFGFFHSPAALAFFRNLQEEGVTVIEDNAQAGFSRQTTGDFVFNSLRKLVPYDGGYLKSRWNVAPLIEAYPRMVNRRLPVIRAYRAGLYRYLFRERGNHASLDSLFRQAEQSYEEDIVIAGDAQERELIERLDWQAILQVRRDNYRLLAEFIRSIPQVQPVFPILQEENLPLGLPVYLHGVSRDEVNEELSRRQISLTIHWDELQIHPLTRANREAVERMQKILTLAIDQRHSPAHMEYLAQNLADAVRKAAKTK